MFSSRWRCNTSFWFLLWDLPLVIFESTFHPPPPLSGVTRCPPYHCCASKVTGALLLLLSLASPPGAPGWQEPPFIWDLLSHRKRRGEPGRQCLCVVWYCCVQPGAATEGEGAGARVMGPPWLSCHCCPVTCGCRHQCSRDASPVHRLTCCRQVLWGRGIAGTASTAAPVPPPLCVPVHPPLDVQMCGILWHPGV